jgi:hypothetical protein
MDKVIKQRCRYHQKLFEEFIETANSFHCLQVKDWINLKSKLSKIEDRYDVHKFSPECFNPKNCFPFYDQ